MRPIKFRAWDKKEKEMRTIQDNWSVSVLNDNTNYELMQYTGLKDKNGKEIYEGDIVKYQNRVWQIEYSGDRFLLRKYCDSDLFIEAVGEIRVNDDLYEERMYWGDIEVIGDIYSTPELLKEDK